MVQKCVDLLYLLRCVESSISVKNTPKYKEVKYTFKYDYVKYNFKNTIVVHKATPVKQIRSVAKSIDDIIDVLKRSLYLRRCGTRRA